MEVRPIEVKLLFAKDLKDVNRFSTMDVYVVASVSGDPRSIQRTPVDKDGGTNPNWNFDMKFTVDEAAAQQNRLGLLFQIMSERKLGDKEIGRVYVPLRDLLLDHGGPATAAAVDSGAAVEERHVTYQVQIPNGRFKGTLEFKYKIGEKFTAPKESKLDEPPPPIFTYPAAGVGAALELGGYPPPPGAPLLTVYGCPTWPGYGCPLATEQKEKKKKDENENEIENVYKDDDEDEARKGDRIDDGGDTKMKL